jgi:1-deoxy-D-xylulose-5-phosphate reductoisomerase
LNGADEAAVDFFLSGKIRFSQIPEVIESALCDHKAVAHPDLEAILQANQWAKESVRTRIKDHINKR